VRPTLGGANHSVDFAAPKRIVQQTGKQYGRICPSCGERASISNATVLTLASVVGASQMRVLSLFWVVPVWPVGPEKEIWGCGRCGEYVLGLCSH
jgi:ribosomal protein S27AE